MKTNLLLLPRSVEEYYLANCDNTCVAKKRCRCVKDLGMDICGQSLSKWGSPYCILCLRYHATKYYNVNNYSNKEKRLNYYVNIFSEYDSSCYLDYDNTTVGTYHGIYGVFVKYKKSDYIVAGENEVVQVFERQKSACWISLNFAIDNTKIDDFKEGIQSESWELCFCSNQQCKLQLLSEKETKYAIGIVNTNFNLGNNKIDCEKCNQTVTFLKSNTTTNLINYNNKYITRCYFCCTLVDYKPLNSIQVCSGCFKDIQKETITNTRVCSRCNNNVSNSKRGGGINKYTILDKDGNKRNFYLCKIHKLKKNMKKIYTEEEFAKLIN